MNNPSKWLSRLLAFFAVLVGIGSILVFAAFPLGSLRVVRPAWSEEMILAWNAALSLLFFLQHSGMIRQRARGAMRRFLAPICIPAVYAITSGLALSLVVVLWQPSQTQIFSLHGPARIAVYALAAIAFGLLAWGWRTLRSFDPLGLRPLMGSQHPDAAANTVFAARGAYGLVRHPLYLAIILLIWAVPDLTTDRLLFDVLWTAWIVLGTILEEADLVAECGESYRAYQRIVPMLIPWSKPQAGLRAEEQQS